MPRQRIYLKVGCFQTRPHFMSLPGLTYCNSLLSGSTTKSLKTFPRIQNNAACFLTGSQKQVRIPPVQARLYWLPMKSRIEFKVVLLTYKRLNAQVPLYLKSYILILRSKNAGLLVVPKISKSNLGDRTQVPLPVCWADTISEFKSRLKTICFDKAESLCRYRSKLSVDFP